MQLELNVKNYVCALGLCLIICVCVAKSEKHYNILFDYAFVISLNKYN